MNFLSNLLFGKQENESADPNNEPSIKKGNNNYVEDYPMCLENINISSQAAQYEINHVWNK